MVCPDVTLSSVEMCRLLHAKLFFAQSPAALGKDNEEVEAIRPRLTSLVYCLLVDSGVEGHLTPRRPWSRWMRHRSVRHADLSNRACPPCSRVIRLWLDEHEMQF